VTGVQGEQAGVLTKRFPGSRGTGSRTVQSQPQPAQQQI